MTNIKDVGVLARIKVKTSLIKNKHKDEYICDAIKQDKKIIYNDKLCKVTISLNEEMIMTRENDEYKIEMHFIPDAVTDNAYSLKNSGTVYLPMKTYSIIKETDKIIIEYQILGSEKIKYILEEI